MQYPVLYKTLESRISVLENQIVRLIGEDGNDGVLGDLAGKVGKLEKYAIIAVCIIAAGNTKSVIDLIKLITK